MAKRQSFSSPASKSVPGYTRSGVTQSELRVSKIAGLVFRPGMFDWEVPKSNDRFLDRVSDTPYLPLGATTISARFSNAANGKRLYKVDDLHHPIHYPGFDSAASFTIGLVIGPSENNVSPNVGGFSFGSIGAVASSGASPGAWWVSTGTGASYGKAFFRIGTQANQAFTGVALDPTKLSTIVFVLDREAGTATVRINGVEDITLTSAALKAMVLVPGLAIGGQKTAGANAVSVRQGHYGGPVAFNRALTDADLTDLERYLAEIAA